MRPYRALIILFCLCYLLLNAEYVAASSKPVLEVVVFHVKAKITQKQILQAAKAVAPLLKTMPGFESRSIGKGQVKGEWVDIVKWKSLADALSAAQKVMTHKNMIQYVNLMSSYKMYHFTLM